MYRGYEDDKESRWPAIVFIISIVFAFSLALL